MTAENAHRRARQRAGEITRFTGVDDPYEPPLDPDWVIPAHQQATRWRCCCAVSR